MRHRKRGRKLGRNASHRKAMFRNMAISLIRTVRVDEDDPNAPAVPGRIKTTVPKAKELRPFVEKLITLAKRALPHQEAAAQYATTAAKNSDAWKTWRNSDEWQKWTNTIAPAVASRRRAFSILRDDSAVDILFSELAERYRDREGGYTRVVRTADVRLGDAGEQAIIEFVGVGDRDRVKKSAFQPTVVESDSEQPAVSEEGSTGETSPDTEGDATAVDTESGADSSEEE